ncbi:hypothetical protein [Algoriphagus sp.]|uniref:hypothetical protein n=1 Tax=Algoriphagus sp. TaxID=1872435 RepID=UPI00391DA80A
MGKKNWTLLIGFIVVLILILLVYFFFEKRIEAIPDQINQEKSIAKDSLLSVKNIFMLMV